jgi:hypothetical protein
MCGGSRSRSSQLALTAFALDYQISQNNMDPFLSKGEGVQANVDSRRHFPYFRKTPAKTRK